MDSSSVTGIPLPLVKVNRRQKYSQLCVGLHGMEGNALWTSDSLVFCVFVELSLPAAAGPGLLPLAQGSSSGPEAPEPAHQRSGRDQAG